MVKHPVKPLLVLQIKAKRAFTAPTSQAHHCRPSPDRGAAGRKGPATAWPAMQPGLSTHVTKLTPAPFSLLVLKTLV